jgi:trehalose/maltose hydrolase-like predicted phosphorylase
MMYKSDSAVDIQSRAKSRDAAYGTSMAPVDKIFSELALMNWRSSAPDWLLAEEGFTLAREHEVESLLAIANGYVGNRGSLAEGSRLSAPATFGAGIFEYNSRAGVVPGLFVLPDWTGIQVWVEGEPLSMHQGEVLEHRRILDLRCGVLWREWSHRDPSGRTTRLVSFRLASLADRHLLLQSMFFIPENFSGEIRLEAAIEVAPNVQSFAPSEEWKTRRDATRTNVLPLALRSPGSGVIVAFAAASQFTTHGSDPSSREIEMVERRITERFSVNAEMAAEYRLDRVICMYTSRDVPDPIEASIMRVNRVLSAGTRSALAAHRSAWEARWQSADVQIEGDDFIQRALRFAEYHLIAAANPDDDRVSIGARALTGEAYKGHVFWDTEIYMVPFYTFTAPHSARALLMYRYHTLPAARDKARAFGFRGAMYPWESADSGEETTPRHVIGPDGVVIRVLNGDMEVHISADVAYAVWQYFHVTGDDDFFLNAGAEMILETARFWASRGRIEDDALFHIRGVIGPDEYHENVDDSAYTNLMARWNLRRGVDTARILKERWPDVWRQLSHRLEISAEELNSWEEVANSIFTGFDATTGVFEQFRGYYQKEALDLRAYEPRNTALDVILGHESIQRTNVVKQADVVMAMYLLWDELPAAVRGANFRYYEPRTGHGSSLSPSIHALVAARLGDLPLAGKYLRQAAEIDLGNNMGNAAGGVHAAAIGGLWQAVVFGFAGMEVRADGVRFSPNLLPHWRRLAFPVQWRGRKLRVTIGLNRVHVMVEEGDGPIILGLAAGTEVQAMPGQQFTAEASSGGWQPWRSLE